MQLRKPRAQVSIFKVQGYRFENVAAEFLPSLSLGEDRLP